jgi:diguanylate cyclase (GGDEF)-like protein
LAGWAGAAALVAGVIVLAASPPSPLVWALAAALVAIWGAAAIALFLLHRRSIAAEMQAGKLRQRVSLVMETMPGGFALYDAENRLVIANSRFMEKFPAVIPGGTPGDALPELSRISDGGLDHHLSNGRWYRLTRQILPEGGFALSAVDVTTLKRQEEQLAMREARQRVILNMAPVGIWELDDAGRTVFANSQAGTMLGGKMPASLAEAELHQVLGGRAQPEILQQQRLQRSAIEVEHAGGKGGRPRRMLMAASCPLPEASSTDDAEEESPHTRLVTLLDITERRAAQAEAERLTWQDSLTGLGNRVQFLRVLEEQLNAGGGLTLLSIELGGLGRLNERHGHGVGDTLLRAAAARLTQAVRADDAVFRVGGNKFCVLASGLDQKAARWLADRLFQILLNAFRHGGLEVGLTPAIGVSRSPPLAGDVDVLRRTGDLARQRSAIEGNVVVYEEALGDEAEHSHRLREALVGAIAAGEFRLHWQAQVDAESHQLIGAEALLRWRCAALGREVSPAELFPAAADVGLLGEIDLWVLEEALATKRRWSGRKDAPAVIAINISAGSLREQGFADLVMEALQRHGVPPGALEIEIPEDVPARDLDALAQTLEALSSHGVRLSLDDFGGGASSMAHLVQLPVDRVKLDRSIVRGLPNGSRESAVLRAVAAVARSLEIELLGEGVENEAQTLTLRGQGCTAMQGFLYGRPMPADELVRPLGL